ncbi:MAG: thioredoxin family protein [Limnochordaceae bacterium]|nr:thioredoxin family protein [Limnochordaceae bacterium]
MLNQKDRQFIQDFFAKELTGPVKILLFTTGQSEEASEGQKNPYLSQIVELMEEVVTASDKLSLQVVRRDQDPELFAQYDVPLLAVPALALLGAGDKDYGIRFWGTPAGYEFRTLMDDIVDVSRGRTKLSEETRRKLAELKTPIRMQVFVTPTCPYCPKAVRTAHQFAMESPLVRAEMVEAQEFPDLANQYQVYGVPKTVINDGVQELEGALPEEAFLEAVVAAAGAAV